MPSDAAEAVLLFEVEWALEGAQLVNGCKVTDARMSADGMFTYTLHVPHPLEYFVLETEPNHAQPVR